MEQTEELRQIVEDASKGYWMPLTLVSLAFSIIIGLLLYIWNQMLKQNEKRHLDHEIHNDKQDKTLEKVSEVVESLRLIVTEIKTKQDISSSKR